MDKVNRQSNFELLRILAAMGVVVLHFVYPRGIQNVSSEANTLLLFVFQSICISSVNIFIMLSGYFLINNEHRTIKKPLDLLIQLEFIQIVCFALFCYYSHSFDILELLSRLVPVDYFITLYIALYFISPYINKSVISFDDLKWKKMIAIGLLFLSVLPIASDILVGVSGKEWLGSNTLGHWGGNLAIL